MPESSTTVTGTPIPTYAVYDVEVTTRSPVGFAASPFYPDNKLVLSGWKDADGHIVKCNGLHHPFPKAKLYVGCNIKFDLLWAARKNWSTPAYLVKGARVWDISLAQYILSRQRERMPSLDRCAELHGLVSHKHGHVSAQIKAGICPSAIPISQLDSYHTDDLNLTEAIFLRQFEEAKKRGMLPLIWSQMQALVATCEMEHHGLLIDRLKLESLAIKYTMESANAAKVFADWLRGMRAAGNDVAQHWYSTTIYEAEISSNKSLSLLFFGGEITLTERELVGKYKNGKDKYKNKTVEKKLRGAGLDPSFYGAELNKNGYYTVDDSVLKSIADGAPSMEVRGAAEAVRKFRTAQKQLSTYIDGVRQNIWPDSRVHCSFNHSVTLTGRLSCSNPNLQNQTDGPIKEVYVATPGYYYMEFDYSQLEVVGLAILSGDAQLLSDISSGVDIHSVLFEEMYGRSPTVAERKAFKPLTFGLIYGAGAKTLAENSGRTLKEAKHFIAVFYRRYSAVQAYHEKIQDDARLHRLPSAGLKSDKGIPIGLYVHRTATGREYEFREYDSLAGYGRTSATSFSPTELKNWPIQGFSTGDVVPLMLGYVVSEITNSEWYGKIRPVVTVHDSLMFEVFTFTTTVEQIRAENYLIELMSKTRQVILDRFGFDVGLELKTEFKRGANWKEMH